MKIQRVDLWTGMLVTVSWVLAIGVFASMNRRAGGFAWPALSVFIPPLTAAAVWAWIALTVAHHPPNSGAPTVREHLRLTQLVVAALCLATVAGPFVARSGASLPYGTLEAVVLGIVFVALGNHTSKLRKNATLGIRNAWTIADSEVWLRTHRLLARVLVVGGFAIVAAALWQPEGGRWILGIAVALVIATIGVRFYSFVEYRRRHRNDP